MKIIDNNIELYSGDDNVISYRHSDYTDLTSIDLYFTVKEVTDRSSDDSNAVYKVNPTDIVLQDIEVDGVIKSNAIAIIPVSKSSERIPVGAYKYDLQRVDDGVSTIMSGSYTVINDVTKRK